MHLSTSTPALFHRVRSPGPSAGENLAVWDSLKPRNYRYRFEDARVSQSYFLWGTVTVTNGVKTVTDSFANEFLRPRTNPNPALILSLEEVFAQLSGIETQGIHEVRVSYDQTWGFPSNIYKVHSPAAFSRLTITDFEELPD
jgi:hypothetical protein